MDSNPISPQNALNQAYRKVKPYRKDIEAFRENLLYLISQVDDAKDEENHKTEMRDFLKKTYFGEDYYFNVKQNIDWAIFNGPKSSDSVGVIIETKRPTNKSEMVTKVDLNRKAFHELILYYLRERITEKNLEVRHLIISNVHEWFIFDAQVFEKLFAKNKSFVKQFQQFESGQLSSNNTATFYNDIARPFVEQIKEEISFTHFNLKDYESILKKPEVENSRKLIALFKILSPEHLLKLSFANDSNSLNRDFYKELLHIIGLEDKKEKGKHIIQRKPKDQRDAASLLENTIKQLDKRDLIYQVENPKQYGASKEDQLFGVGLELVITWVNRVLFLKLLEAQLISYNKDKAFAFLNSELIHDYDDLDDLFFGVLAKRLEDRDSENQEKFGHVPYLNSSLFEATELESKALFVSTLRDERLLPIAPSTVLKDENGKKRKGELSTLNYLFSFLDAYDFSSENGEEIQEEKKTLINASVLGLIFEKINGYKDGSFFTPGFITMYMCRETIRRAVLQKFKEEFDIEAEDIDDLYGQLDRKKKPEYNAAINSLKICDPAVGSGHFLVSALNELIAIKGELEILIDKDGKPLRDCTFEVINDELIIKLDDELFRYNPKNRTSQRIQETIFHEKQTIIENCLFGVDINPNSVKICRLRLWIELLKHAYYKTNSERHAELVSASTTSKTLKQVQGDGLRELETLPNIDINIKCGNSLISRFGLDEDLSGILKSIKWDIEAYRGFVRDYKHAASKEEKKGLEQLIGQIKKDFRTEIAKNDPKLKRKNRLAGELYNLTQEGLFEESAAQEKKRLAQVVKKEKELNKLSAEIEEIQSNKIFENAFEWRFEFPEVLNDEGDFLGFDVVIGNPPYFSVSKIQDQGSYFKEYYRTYAKATDIYCLFYERGNQIIKSSGYLTYITSNSWLRAIYGELLKDYFKVEMQPLELLNIEDIQVFEEATVESNILTLQKAQWEASFPVCNLGNDYLIGESLKDYFNSNAFDFEIPNTTEWIITDEDSFNLKAKIEVDSKHLGSFDVSINFGIKTGYNAGFIIDDDKRTELINLDSKNEEIIVPILRGRDLKKYSFSFEKMYLINSHNGLKEKNIDPINVQQDYPSIFEHFTSFLPKIEQRQDKGAHWSNLRNCAYLEDFAKPKIIWGEISDKPKFSYENEGYYQEATTFLMTGEKLKFLLAILNSNVSEWYFHQIGTTTGMGTNRWKKYKIEQLPIKEPTSEQEEKFESKVNQILALKKENPQADTSALEAEIDQMVYELYGLSEEAIGIIEGS